MARRSIQVEDLRLTPTEAELLLRISKGKGEVVSYADLLSVQFPDQEFKPKHYASLSCEISRIRRKLDEANYQIQIATERGVGCRLIDKVEGENDGK